MLKTEKKQYKLLRVVIFIVLALFGIIIRSIFVTKMAVFPTLINNAFILDTNCASINTISMEYIYTAIFSFLFSLLGNKAEVAVYFQIVLHIIGIVILFFAIKKFTNPVCAWICYLVFICMPFVFSISINQLFFLFFAIIFGISAIYTYILSSKELNLIIKTISSVLISFVFTQLLFLDSIFVIFLLFGLLISLFISNGEKQVRYRTKIICMFSYIIGSVITFTIYFAEKSKPLFQNFIYGLFTLNTDTPVFFKEFKLSMQVDKIYFYTILGVFILFMIFSFFQNRKTHTALIISLFLGLNMFWILFKTNINPYMVVITLAWIIFVLGVQSVVCLINYKKEELENEQEEIEIEMNEEVLSAVIESKEEVIVSEEVTNESNLIKKINYIENPLPVPKRHVPKVLDYIFDPKPEDMHYDLDD